MTLLSEKLDGVWARWDGSHFWSRNGREFPAPQWFRDALPKGVILYGELWAGRGKFERAVTAVRSGKEWGDLTFMVFDAKAPGDVRARLAEAEKNLSGCAVARVMEQVECTGEEFLTGFLEGVALMGGEGVMERNEWDKVGDPPTKHKTWQTAEGEVIWASAGQLGVRWNDVEFGLCGVPRRHNPFPKCPDGKTVTFRYLGLTAHGIPRHPVFVAVRDYE